MNFWTAAVIIFLIWGVVQMYRARQGIVEDEDGNQSALPRGDAEASQRELEELRERVKVLERIATDGREAKRLDAEIERLRDE